MGEGLYGAVFHLAAPEPAKALDRDRADHDGDGWNAQFDHAVVRGEQAVETFQADLEEGGDHDDGEDQHADGLETASADRVRVLVLLRDESRRGPDDGGGEEVECSVDQRSEHGQGRGQHDDGDFAGQENDVGDEVDVDGDRDDRVVRVEALVHALEVDVWQGRVRDFLLAVVKEWSGFVGQFVQVLRRPFDFRFRGRGASKRRSLASRYGREAGVGRVGLFVVARRLLGNGVHARGESIAAVRPHLVVLLDQVVRKRRIQQLVNVDVLGDQEIVPLVVFPDRFLHLLQLLLRLVVLMPLVSGIALPDQPHAAHLRGHEDLGPQAHPSRVDLHGCRGTALVSVQRFRLILRAMLFVFGGVVAVQGASSLAPWESEERRARAALDETWKVLASSRHGAGLLVQWDEGRQSTESIMRSLGSRRRLHCGG